MVERLRRNSLFLLGLSLAWLPFARALFDSSLTFLYRDLTNVYLPFKAIWARAVLELGRIPHWNPYHAAGIPMFSDPALGTFHPLNVIFLLFSARPERGLVFFLVAHYLVLFVGGYVLARSRGARKWLAFAAGLSLAWGGFALSCLYNPHDLAGQIAVPFYFYFLRRAAGTPRRRWRLGAALALAFPAFCGDAQFSYMLALISGFLWLASPGKRARALLLGKIFLNAALLSAPQLLPTLSHFGETTRASGALASSEQLFWSLHPLRLVELLLPLPFGSKPDFGDYLGYPFVHSAFRADPFVFSFYPGIFCSLFGLTFLFAWAGRRREVRWAPLVGYALLLFLALGAYSPLPVATLFSRFVPLWGAFRYPERLTYWLAFFAWLASVQAAEKVARLASRGALLRPWVPAAVFSACAAAWIGWQAPQSHEVPASALSLACFLAGAGLIAEASRKRNGSLLIPACALLVAFETGATASRLAWEMPAEITRRGLSQSQNKIFADQAKNALALSRGSAFRVYTLPQAFIDESDPAEIHGRMKYGSQEREVRKAWSYIRYYTGSFFGLELANRQNTFIPSHPIYTMEKKSPASLNRFLDLASVRYFVMEPERRVLARASALPYASFPRQTEFASDPISRAGDLSWDPHRSVLLEGNLAPAANPQCWFVQDVRRAWDEVSLQLTSSGSCEAAWLLVNEAMEPGWTAFLPDGNKAELRRANAWAIAVKVPGAAKAGETLALRLEYREPSFFRGCLLGLLGLAAGALL